MTWMICEHPHDLGNFQKAFASNGVAMNQPSKLSNGELFVRTHISRLRRAPPLALWQVRALPPLRWGLGIPPLPWLQGVSLDPMESPHPNCLVQRSQKCKSMDWVKTSRAGPIQRCTLSSQRACRRSASHAGAKCFSKLVRSSWAQKAALGEDGWTAHQAHWDTRKKKGFKRHWYWHLGCLSKLWDSGHGWFKGTVS